MFVEIIPLESPKVCEIGRKVLPFSLDVEAPTVIRNTLSENDIPY